MIDKKVKKIKALKNRENSNLAKYNFWNRKHTEINKKKQN